ncbi:MAG: AraC family transcriptional regulator [Oscillospiraceae bacterium]|nr:AraC family transcriptional regulator [Oscillospiraceae bacterium]MDD3261184.1 AraC family transcriptional regulator [Oscillospiraceae bacterium]
MDFQYTKLQDRLTVEEIVTVHYFEYTRDFFFPGETHDFWEFVYVDKGEVTITQGSRTAALHRGDIAFHQPMEFHNLRASGETAPDLAVVSFVCRSPAMDFFRGRILQAGNSERDCISQLIAEAHSAFLPPLDDPSTRGMQQRSPELVFGAQQMLRITLERLLLQLVRGQCAGSRPQPLSTRHAAHDEQDIVNQVILYMEEHCCEKLSLDAICQANSIGRSHLQKLFHARMGCGIIAYFRRIKAETAKQLLRTGSCTVEEIADQLGYTGSAYFSRDFKQCTGMTPTEYSTSAKLRTALYQKPHR